MGASHAQGFPKGVRPCEVYVTAGPRVAPVLESRVRLRRGETMDSPESEGTEEAERVTQVLAQLRAGVRQRQAELAGSAVDTGVADVRLARLWALGNLGEPPCESPRAVAGPLLVALRRSFFRFFVRWHVQPLAEQQSALNHEQLGLLRELLVELAEQRRRDEQLDRRLGILERRLERVEGGDRG